LTNVVLISPIQLGQRGGILHFKMNYIQFGGAFITSFYLSDGLIKLAHCKKKKKKKNWNWEAPHLISAKQNRYLQNFMQPVRWLNMHPPWALFFPFGGGGRALFFVFLPCSQCVPNMYSWCSPNLFLKAFPIAPQFYPIWFAQSSTLVYINWKGGP
jgi:hypothetical protein